MEENRSDKDGSDHSDFIEKCLDPNGTMIIKLKKAGAKDEDYMPTFANLWLDLIKGDNAAFYKRGLELIKGTVYDLGTGNEHESLVNAIADKVIRIKQTRDLIDVVKGFWKRVGKVLRLNITEDQLQKLTIGEYVTIAAAQLRFSNAIFAALDIEANSEYTLQKTKVMNPEVNRNKLYFKSTLSTDEAQRLVGIVERILTSPKLVYGYKLSELEGYSRLDVAHAFMINLAQVYKDGRNHPAFETEISKFVNAMDSSLVIIATTGIPDSELLKSNNNYTHSELISLAAKWSLLPLSGIGDSNPVILEEQKLFGEVEMPSSIAKYCSEVLQPHDPDYWQKLYAHIGLELPKLQYETKKEWTNNKNINEKLRPAVISNFYMSAMAIYALIGFVSLVNEKDGQFLLSDPIDAPGIIAILIVALFGALLLSRRKRWLVCLGIAFLMFSGFRYFSGVNFFSAMLEGVLPIILLLRVVTFRRKEEEDYLEWEHLK